MSDSEGKSKTGKYVWGIVLIGLGLFMFSDPDAMDSSDHRRHGRHAGKKMLLEAIWGRPGGVLLLAVGGFIFYSAVRETSPKEPEAPEPRRPKLKQGIATPPPRKNPTAGPLPPRPPGSIPPIPKRPPPPPNDGKP